MTNYKELDTILYVDKLCVSYGEKQILKDVSFIEKNVVREGYNSTGQVIAFIGRSGRGKSTLFKALTGLLKPTSGQILLKDMAKSEFDEAKLVREGDIGFVDQKYTLFRHETIEQICMYALRKQTLTKEEKKEIINKYLIDWGLDEHRKKYSCELSGGQRQRIAIARAILKNARILILDEATSAFDSVTEKYIQDALYYLMQGKTTLVVAHRLSTLSEMDRIFVFDNGVIIEDGTHDQLIKLNGHYAKLWHMQAGGFLPE